MASRKVELKAAMRLVGISDMNPTVSIKSIDKLQGNRQEWAVTSNVANKASFGCILASPLSDLISVVLPRKYQVSSSPINHKLT